MFEWFIAAFKKVAMAARVMSEDGLNVVAATPSWMPRVNNSLIAMLASTVIEPESTSV